MGCQNMNIVVACLVVVLAAATPLVQGQLNLLGTAANLTTSICCSPSGSCIAGAAGLANVTGTLSCLSPITRTLRQVGSGISNADGTLSISVSPTTLITSMVTGILNGGAVPCILSETFKLVNQASCPVINVLNSTVVSSVQLVGIVPSILNGVRTAVLAAVNPISINATIGV